MSTAYASFPFELPPHLKYDGVMLMGEVRLLQFTELDQTSPSFGASFYLDAAKLLLLDIAYRRAEVREKFSAAGCGAQGNPATPDVTPALPLGREPVHVSPAAEPSSEIGCS